MRDCIKFEDLGKDCGIEEACWKIQEKMEIVVIKGVQSCSRS